MGNDGGSIPKRRELVRSAAAPPTSTQLKESRTLAQEYAWAYCSLSRLPLAAPLAADAAGRLYNKDAVLEVLLPASADVNGEEDAERARKKAEAEERGVRGLRDVVEVRFEVDEGPAGETKWVCPVSRRALGPGAKAVYLVPCGHAFAGAAVRELAAGGQPGEGGKCAVCNEAYESGNVVPIAPTDADDIKRLDTRIRDLHARGLTHSLKKAPGSSKKRKKDKNGTPVVAAKGADEILANGGSGGDAKGKAAPSGVAVASNGIKNAATASLTQRVLEEQSARKRARTDNENVKSLFTSSGAAKDGVNGGGEKDKGRIGDFMTRGFTIPVNARR